MELRTITAFLKEEAKQKLQKEYRRVGGGRNSETVTDYYIGYTRVTIQQGVVHTEVPADEPISQEISDFIIGFKAECEIDEKELGSTRNFGKYILPEEQDAEKPQTTCSVTRRPYCKDGLKLSLSGPSREKIIALFELVRDGKIRPNEEFGGPQSGKSRVQLEAELTATQQHLGKALEDTNRFSEQSKLVRKLFDEKMEEVSKVRNSYFTLYQSFSELRADLVAAWWPFCRKATVAGSIDAILTGK